MMRDEVRVEMHDMETRRDTLRKIIQGTEGDPEERRRNVLRLRKIE
jgi:hypothetical protein